MLDFTKALTFEEYLEKQQEKYGDVQNKAYEGTILSDVTKNNIQALNETIHLAVFSEGFCPDCIVTLPFLQRLKEENPNLKVHIFPRTGFEDFLNEAVGDSRIPTVISFNSSMAPKGAYVEMPQELSAKMLSLTMDERKALISEYRAGKYNDLIEKNLLNIIL